MILFDVETDGLEYTKVHCIAAKVEGTSDPPKLFTDIEAFLDWVYEQEQVQEKWIAHNACGFDYWVIKEMVFPDLREDQIIDTSVLSKLRDYKKYNTHSLKEIGKSLGTYKGEYTGDWKVYTTEMGDYCIQDVVVLEKIWNDLKPYYDKLDYKSAIEVEHNMAFICRDIQDNGFSFNKPKAEKLLSSIQKEMSELEDSMDKAFPPTLVVAKTNKIRKTKEAKLFKNILDDLREYPRVVFRDKDGEYDCYDYKRFNPRSPVDRIDVLWGAGWKPYVKTKGHINATKRTTFRK